MSPTPSEPQVIPVIEERLAIATERRETGAVRVRLETSEHEVSLPLERSEERVAVERVTVNRVVEQRREPWHDGDALVVPVYAEVAIVERRLMLVEEIRLTVERHQGTQTVTVPLRKQRAVVERRQPDGRWVEVDPGTGQSLAGDSADPQGAWT